uniref:Oligomycin sensitivity conferral protein n=1 Tax=Romanomermis culicivorax TaxID=13658 RepID=A0A915JLM0_ROMCU
MIISLINYNTSLYISAMISSVKLVRGLSTSSNLANLVRPPIPAFGTDGRYAIALYSAASKKNKLDAVESDMKTLHDLWQHDHKLREFFLNPVNTRELKKQAFSTVAKKKNFTELTTNLFGVVAEQTRFGKFDTILKTYLKLMSAHRGEVQCEITTAKEVDAKAMEQIKAAVQGFLKSGQKMNISVKVDPSILGGMIVSIGDKYVDMSIASRIKMYTKSIEEAM